MRLPLKWHGCFGAMRLSPYCTLRSKTRLQCSGLFNLVCTNYSATDLPVRKNRSRRFDFKCDLRWGGASHASPHLGSRVPDRDPHHVGAGGGRSADHVHGVTGQLVWGTMRCRLTRPAMAGGQRQLRHRREFRCLALVPPDTRPPQLTVCGLDCIEQTNRPSTDQGRHRAVRLHTIRATSQHGNRSRCSGRRMRRP